MLQECIDGFTRNWETRVFWFNGEFLQLGLQSSQRSGLVDLLLYVVIFAQVCNCQQGSRFNRGLRAWDSLAIVTWPKVPEFLLFPRMAQRSLSQACNRPSATTAGILWDFVSR